MKKLLMCLFVLAGISLTGCTMTETPSERCARIRDIDCMQMRMAVEDCDYFWLQDRVSNLTPWHVRAGLNQ